MDPGKSGGGGANISLRLAEDGLMWREVEDEIIVLDKQTWTYMNINGSGAFLWKEIAQGATPASLVKCLCENFDVDEDTSRNDVDAFLLMAESHGLLLSRDG